MLNVPLSESNGPDRLNLHVNCRKHHSGIRTGFPDYCCCCNPCLYKRFDQVGQIDDKHCCRCSPEAIVVKFTPTNADACCRGEIAPLFGVTFTDANSHQMIKYSGTIAGYAVEVYLSTNRPSGSSVTTYPGNYYEDILCRWTIRIPSLYIDEEIEIDHTTVTCLGVPSVSITNVTAFDTCVGTISLLNFEAEKIPFQLREFPDTYEDSTIPIPVGYICGSCETLPKFLCVSGLRSENGSPGLVEFTWDETYTPTADADGNDIIGKWTYTPNTDPVGQTETLYLVISIYDQCEIWTDFESPFDASRTNETYDPIPVTSCGCDFKILNIVSTNTIEDVSIPSMDIRTGKCGCWKHYCGTCRCVPKNLCGFAFIDGSIFLGIRFEWNAATKSWVSVSGTGTDVNGYVLAEELTIALVEDPYGDCQAEVTHYGHTIDPVVIGCGSILDLTFTSDPDIDNGTAIFDLHVISAFTDDCDDTLSCDPLPPCTDCDAKPERLTLTLSGFNLPGDEPGFEYESCDLTVDLVYVEEITDTGVGIEVTCGYIGFAIVPCTIVGVSDFDHFRFFYSGDELSVQNINPGVGTEEFYIFGNITCNPYFADYSAAIPIDTCFFGCTQTIQNYLFEIME